MVIKNVYLKSIFCLFLILLIIVSSFILQYQEAKAFFPFVIAGIAITPEILAGAGTLLVAAGLTFATSTDATTAAYEMMSQAGTNLVTNLSNIGTGIVDISTDLWQGITGWIGTKNYIEGNNITSQSGVHYTTLESVEYPFTVGSNVANPVCPVDSITWQGVTYTKQITDYGSSATYDKVRFYKNGVEFAYRLIYDGTFAYMFLCTGLTNLEVQLQYISTSGVLTNSFMLSLSDTYNDDVHLAKDIPLINYNYTGQSIVTNPTYDFVDAGVRKLKIPSTIDGVVNKTYTDVQVTHIAPPAVTMPYQSSWTGKFTDCVPFGDYTFTGTGTYTGTLTTTATGEWEGVWSIPATGARTWTGTYTATDALTWTGTAVETLTPDGTAPFEYPKYIPPAGITTKFPFSIPWDIQRAISSLFVEGHAPVWTITFPPNIFVGGGSIVIDFAQFDVWAKVVRWGVLILFNIFLIIATRKLIGAGGT